MSEEKKCKYCGKALIRKRVKGKLESLRDFNRRNFCNRKHSSLYQHGNKKDTDKEVIEQAGADIKSGDETKYKTAVEILRELANTSKDDTTRLNAAKALAPYETRKASEKPGKKETRADAAKKAASGRFSAGAPPVTMARVK